MEPGASVSKLTHAEYCRQWRQRNQEKVKAYAAAWNAENIERRRAIRQKAAKKWREANRDRYNAARQRRRAANAQQAKAKRTKQIARVPGELFQLQLAANEVWQIANANIPNRLPIDVRDDVISEICVAVYSGSLAIAEIPIRAKAFVSEHYRNRQFHGTVSLNVPLPGGDGATMIDLIPQGATDIPWLGRAR